MGPSEAGPGWKAHAGSAPGTAWHRRGVVAGICPSSASLPPASSSSILTSLYSVFMAGPSRNGC